MKMMLLLCALIAGSGSVWAETVRYGIQSTSSVSITGNGTAPTNSSATFVATNTDKNQMTSGKSQTLTLSGYYGYKVTNITLSMKSNSSRGAGKLSYSTDGETSYIVGSSSDGVNFNNTSWYGSWSTSYVNVSKDVDIEPTTSNSTIIIMIEATVNSLYCESYSITYEPVNTSDAATSVTIDDTGITNTDVYTNTAAGSLSATVKDKNGDAISGAAVTWTSADTNVATIASDGTVTLVGAGTTVITASYAGVSGTYDPSSATYDLTVTDSTPFAGGDVEFVAGTDVGSTTSQNADEVSKSGVTISSTSAALASAQYRFYGSSTTTISTTQGNIVKIVFTEADSDYPISRLSATGYSNGTWTGNAQSVTFTASGQARVSTIVVTVNTKDPVATINGITPTSIDLNDEGSFSCDIVYAKGLTANDATITWYSDNEDVLLIDETDGSYLTGASGGTVNVTVTVTPNDETSYSAVSGHFTVTVVDPNGPGSQDNPYTVAQVINGDADGKTDIWVKGYIVGSWNNNNFDPENLVDTNLALADDYNSTTTIPVELSIASGLRTTWGPFSNQKNINVAQVVLKGNGTKYFSKNAVKGTSVIEKIAEMVTVTSAEYATRQSDAALDYSEGDITAYTATDNGSSVKLTEIEGGQVPANTPVVLYKAGGATVRVPVIDSADAVGENDLRISSGEAYSNAYVLAKPDGKPVGFYLWDEAFMLAAGKVYLQSSASDGARQFLPFNEATGIEETVSSKPMNGEWYDLQGRRVVKAQKGLYIVDGKKVVMK